MQASPLVIEVADNGIGFDDKHRDELFAPFTRLVGRHEYEGSGIGLAICRRIATAHGGTLSARGVPGEGAVFRIELSSPDADPAEGRAPAGKPGGPA